jgi:hypothetical protein
MCGGHSGRSTDASPRAGDIATTTDDTDSGLVGVLAPVNHRGPGRPAARPRLVKTAHASGPIAGFPCPFHDTARPGSCRKTRVDLHNGRLRPALPDVAEVSTPRRPVPDVAVLCRNRNSTNT